MRITSLRIQILSLISLLIGSALFLSHIVQTNFSQLRAMESQVRESYEWESLSRGWTSGVPKETLTQMDALVGTLQPEARAQSWQRLITTQRVEGRRNWESNLDTWQKNEAEFRKYALSRISYHDRQITFYALSGLLAVLSIGIGLAFFLKHEVFRAVQDLSRKMIDFLHDRYTYQFSVPAPTELGELQATFNSLAQRVLINMEELTHLDHAKSEFLSIASHELRTPLTSIKGSLSLMRSGVTGDLNEMSDNLLKIAESETDRLIRLINELLDLAKIEAGKFEVHPSWRSLNEIIQKSFTGLKGLTDSAQVSLVAEDLPPILAHIDGDRIHQVLTNLLSNAIKFSPPGGRVRVEVVTLPNQQIEVSVIDQGKGIAPEDQELIFQKFRQVTGPNNPLVKGTGLGLSIAKALVEEHGGEIGVRSTVGQGSTFYFTIPEWKYNPLVEQPEQPEPQEMAA